MLSLEVLMRVVSIDETSVQSLGLLCCSIAGSTNVAMVLLRARVARAFLLLLVLRSGFVVENNIISTRATVEVAFFFV